MPPVASGEVDPTVFVSVGGDRVAGYMDDALSVYGQSNSLGAIFNTQLEVVGGTTYNQPMIADQSIGINLKDQSQLIMGYKTDCNNETSLSPVRKANQGSIGSWSQNLYATQGPFNNIGIPGISVLNVLSPGYSDPWYDRFRSGGSSAILSDVTSQNPTFVLCDLGTDDIMNYALSGGTGSPIPSAVGIAGVGFNGTYETIVNSISSSGAKGVLCNIPDITEFPYFTTIPYNGLTLDSANAATMNQVFNPLGITFVEGDNPFTVEDQNEPFGVRKLVEGELIHLGIPLDSVKCYGMGSIVPIPDEYVLSLDEINEIHTKTDQFNTIIGNISNNYNFALADFNSVFNSVSLGLTINGVSFSGEFVSGGFFSLDGRNPTPKGMAILANECIRAVNKKYNAIIPYASITDYSGVLFP